MNLIEQPMIDLLKQVKDIKNINFLFPELKIVQDRIEVAKKIKV